jgi:hypothetical protein
MKKYLQIVISIYCIVFLVNSCTINEQTNKDIINNTYPEAQAEIQSTLEEIMSDASNANLEKLTAAHLNSPKFTKFSSRILQRKTFEETIDSETKHYGSISDYNVAFNDLKIDVFGDVGIVTYIPYVSYYKDGQLVEGTKRKTLVFVNTDSGWKIVHEHSSRIQ